jgi:malate dehydrogenase
MAIPADGSYGISEGVIYSFPVTCSAGSYQIVQDLEISDFSHVRLDETDAELREERAAVADLL